MQLPTWLAEPSGEEVRKGGSGEGEKVEEKTDSYRGQRTWRKQTHKEKIISATLMTLNINFTTYVDV